MLGLDACVAGNARSVVNGGERDRSGERIGTGPVESAINRAVSGR